MTDLWNTATATFSPCRAYRYDLWRRWSGGNGKYAMFIGLNPSTADETHDDPTIRRCMRFAADWGLSALCMTNLFAFRSTDPNVMKRAFDPIGSDNDEMLATHAADAAVVVAAWGNQGSHLRRSVFVRTMLHGLHCLKMTQKGEPSHPLYLPSYLRPVAMENFR